LALFSDGESESCKLRVAENYTTKFMAEPGFP
jgi:hypothetical protein